MQLSKLGWTPAWQSAFDPIDRADLEPARVVEEQRGLFTVVTAAGPVAAGISGRLRHETQDRRERPAVGDFVAVFRTPDRATIHRVLPRRTAVVRKVAADGVATGQVVAANVDTVFVVTSLNRDFNPRRLERYLAVVWDSGADPVVLLTKSDLAAEPSAYAAEAEAVAPGVPVHVLSALHGQGVDGVRAYLDPGKTVALIGSSGVGKSTLLNALAGSVLQRVQEVRADDERGRHTTTARQLVRLPCGALVVDTPGLREVALWDAAGLGDAFADVEELARACRFRDCIHEREPGCAVRRAVREGRLHQERLASYKKLQRELAHLERKVDERAMLEEKRKWKRLTVQYRKRTRHKP